MRCGDLKELTIFLEAGSRLPLYQQIYEYIKRDILNGKLLPGEKLPSTRLLAKYLQVSRSTVDLAYDQLVSEGYVQTVPQSGYFVCEMEAGFLEIGAGRAKSRQGDGRNPTLKAKDSGVGELEQAGWGRTEGDVEEAFSYDFSPNTVEWPDFSMNAWRKAVKSMLAEQNEELFLPGNALGDDNLRQAICAYLHQSRGVNCHKSQIIIGAGNEYLLLLLSQILEGPIGVAMESPTYRQAYQIFGNLGWPVFPVPMDEEGMLLSRLRESKARLAYIMPSHQFPLGTVMPMKRRMELLNWAGEGKLRYIIEDDYDSEFRYKGKPIPSLQGIDPYDRVIYLGTFSKSIAPAIRVSYMVLPKQLMALYHKRCGFYSSTVSRIQQQILFHFMNGGYFERHLNKMRAVYRARHDVLLGELKGRIWVKGIRGEHAGLHILVEVQTDKTEAQIIAEAKARGIRVYGLGEYGIEEGVTESDSPVLLLGYAGVSEREIREGIERLSEVLK